MTKTSHLDRIEAVKEWILVNGSRGVIAGILTVVIFLFVTSISVSTFAPWATIQPVFYVFVGLITGNVTIITIVVSISQLLLSKELKPPDELRSQVTSAAEYRESVKSATNQVPPVDPLGFLRLLFESMRQDAQQLGGLAASGIDEEIFEEIDQIVTDVTERTDTVDALLQESDATRITVLSAALTTNFAGEIRHLHQIQSRRGDDLPAHLNEMIDDLVRHLQDIDVARQYFKTIYLQEELAILSRRLFYVSLPVVTILASGLLIFTASSGASVSRSVLGILLPAIITIGLTPLTVLFAFVLRIATISQRTAAMLPFTTPSQGRESGD